MSWHDRNGGWAKGQQRRVNALIFTLFILPLSFLMPFLAIQATRWLIPRLPSIKIPLPLLWIMSIGCAGAMLLILRRARIERSIKRLVPECDGRLCPACRRSLTQLPDVGECPRCGQPYTVKLLHRFWADYVLEPTNAGTWLLKMNAERAASTKAFSLRRLYQLWFSSRSRLDYMVASLLVLYIIASYLLSVFLHVTFLGMFMKMLPYAFMMLGMSLLSRGWARRVGDERFCVVCAYPQAPEAETAEQCPECGGLWNRPGGFHRGRIVKTPWMMFTGATLLLVFFGLISIDLVAPGWAPSMSIPPQELSTQELIEEVMDPLAGFTTNEWTILLSRTMTAEQELSLAEGLLAFRQSRGHFDQDSEGWMHKRMQANALPKKLADRYYREMLEASLVAPKKVRAGQPFSISIACTPHTNIYSGKTGSDVLAVFFGGFYLDESDDPIMRETKVHYGALFGSHPQYTPTTTLTAKVTGTARVRSVLWMVAGDQDIVKGAIHWKPDGSPEIPKGARWAECVELAESVDVTE
ncbi:MAG: hypothetical protein H6818_02230 [Phycisphaerales bacterium]|nr:hypothetical protein [Phycisphaerales bacterium]MCB9863131.1 hypothetical protein [Phycisphaerales bacterium]